MKKRRFHIAHVAGDGTAVLDERESRHALTVLRLEAGDRIELFDDAGTPYEAVIAEIQPGRVVARVESRGTPAAEPSTHVAMAAAPPKGRHLEFMLQKLCELGAAEWIPLRCHRSQAFPSGSRFVRLEKILRESAKQCGRNRVPVLSPPATLEQLCPAFTDYQWVYTAHPGADKTLLGHMASWPSMPKRILILVGPEGGFTGEEIRLTQQRGAVPVSLGTSILRVETAALAAMSVVHQNIVHLWNRESTLSK